MKKIALLISLLLIFSHFIHAQTTIEASKIIESLDNGKNIKYENAIIKGDLNFIDLKDKKVKNKNSKHSTTEYIAQVNNTIEFINCTFKGDVVAYLSTEDNELFSAHFYKKVAFENCIFEKDALFKYVDFDEKGNFKNSTFEGIALFKYTKFNTKTNFSKSAFKNEANFKYTDFEEYVDFSDCIFDAEANFKYTKFPDGVSFENSNFNAFANFKYTKFKAPFSMENVNFKAETSFKYTTLNGKDFTVSLLNNK